MGHAGGDGGPPHAPPPPWLATRSGTSTDFQNKHLSCRTCWVRRGGAMLGLRQCCIPHVAGGHRCQHPPGHRALLAARAGAAAVVRLGRGHHPWPALAAIHLSSLSGSVGARRDDRMWPRVRFGQLARSVAPGPRPFAAPDFVCSFRDGAPVAWAGPGDPPRARYPTTTLGAATSLLPLPASARTRTHAQLTSWADGISSARAARFALRRPAPSRGRRGRRALPQLRASLGGAAAHNPPHDPDV